MTRYTLVRDTADLIMAAVVAGFAAAAVDLPARRYVAAGHPGNVAHDDEQVTVAFAGLGARWRNASGAVSGEMLRSPYPEGVVPIPTATFQVEVIRAVATLSDEGEPPPLAALDAAGHALLVDAATLAWALIDAADRGDLRPAELPEGGRVGVSQVVPYGPAGGMAGSVAQVSVDLL